MLKEINKGYLYALIVTYYAVQVCTEYVLRLVAQDLLSLQLICLKDLFGLSIKNIYSISWGVVTVYLLLTNS